MSHTHFLTSHWLAGCDSPLHRHFMHPSISLLRSGLGAHSGCLRNRLDEWLCLVLSQEFQDTGRVKAEVPTRVRQVMCDTSLNESLAKLSGDPPSSCKDGRLQRQSWPSPKSHCHLGDPQEMSPDPRCLRGCHLPQVTDWEMVLPLSFDLTTWAPDHLPGLQVTLFPSPDKTPDLQQGT